MSSRNITEEPAHADEPLPTPSTSRQLRPYRARSRGRGSSRGSSSASSRASSIARSGPSNFGSLASIATNDPVNITATAYGGLTMDGDAGPSSSSGSQMQIDATYSTRGKKRAEPVVLGSSPSGRAKKRRRVSLEGVAVDVPNLPSDHEYEPMSVVDADAETQRIIDLSRASPTADAASQSSSSPLSTLAQASSFPPIHIDLTDIDAYSPEVLSAISSSTSKQPPIPSSSASQPAASSSKLPNLPDPIPTPTPQVPAIEPLSAYTCPICFSQPTHATLTPCGHVCCGECLFTAVKTTIARSQGVVLREANVARCPVCRATIPGWDGKGGGVIGLKPRIVLSL